MAYIIPVGLASASKWAKRDNILLCGRKVCVLAVGSAPGGRPVFKRHAARERRRRGGCRMACGGVRLGGVASSAASKIIVWPKWRQLRRSRRGELAMKVASYLPCAPKLCPKSYRQLAGTRRSACVASPAPSGVFARRLLSRHRAVARLSDPAENSNGGALPMASSRRAPGVSGRKKLPAHGGIALERACALASRYGAARAEMRRQ